MPTISAANPVDMVGVYGRREEERVVVVVKLRRARRRRVVPSMPRRASFAWGSHQHVAQLRKLDELFSASLLP